MGTRLAGSSNETHLDVVQFRKVQFRDRFTCQELPARAMSQRQTACIACAPHSMAGSKNERSPAESIAVLLFRHVFFHDCRKCALQECQFYDVGFRENYVYVFGREVINRRFIGN